MGSGCRDFPKWRQENSLIGRGRPARRHMTGSIFIRFLIGICRKGLGRHKSSGFSGPGFPQPESENSLIGQKLHQRSTHDRETFIRIMIG